MSLWYNRSMHAGGKLGFTLVEVALSMAFIAILSITMVLIINDAVATYRRGLTLNNVATSGAELVQELTSSIKDSPKIDLETQCQVYGTYDYLNNTYTETDAMKDCKKHKALNFTSLKRYATVKLNGRENNGSDEIKVPVYGAICTGKYSYIWNSGYFFGEENGTVTDPNLEPAKFIYDSANSNPNPNSSDIWRNPVPVENFRLLKVVDDQRAVCKTMNKVSADSYGSSYKKNSDFHDDLGNVFDITNPQNLETNSNLINYYDKGIPDDNVMVLYANDETNPLSLYDLDLLTPAMDDNRTVAFYTGSFILGTLQGGIDINATGNFCKTPEGYNDEEFDYCAINKFNFAVQAKGAT